MIWKLVWAFLFFTGPCCAASFSSPSLSISSSGVNASYPMVGIGSNGTAVAVWLENQVVMASSIQQNQSWTPPQAISNSNASSPLVVVDLNGNATAIWIEGGVATASSLPNAGVWSASSALSSSGASTPEIAVDITTGNVIAVWTRNGSIETSILPFGGSWPGSPTVISSGTADSPSVAYQGGNAAAVWHEAVGSVDTIYAAEYSSGSWGAQAAISTSGVNSVSPDVAIDPTTGDVTVVWLSYTGDTPNNTFWVQATTLSSGSWSTPSSISGSGVGPVSGFFVLVEIDGQGNNFAMWSSSTNGGAYNIQSSVMPAGGSWGSVFNFVQLDPYASSFDLSADANGDAYVVFMSYDFAGQILRIIAEMSNTSTFSPNYWVSGQILSQSTPNGYPKIAIRSNTTTMNGAAVWLNTANSVTSVQAAYVSANIVQLLLNLSGVQNSMNMGFSVVYCNDLSWNNPSDSIAGFAIYRNNVFLTTVGPSTLTYSDHNRDPAYPDTYKIIAFDGNLNTVATGSLTIMGSSS